MKEGTVYNNIIKEGDSPDAGTFYTNESYIKIKNEEKSVISTNIFELKKGDKVKVRIVGEKYNNMVFEVNGKIVGSKYDWMDYVSPFMMLITGYFLYQILISKIFMYFKRRFSMILIAIVASNQPLVAQTTEVSCSESPYVSFEAKNFKTHQYSPVLVAKKAYSSLKEVANAFPEGLIESEMSVISQEWSSFNYGKTRESEPKRYALNQKVDVSKNYANLLYKVQYEVNGEEFAIVKLHIYSEGKEEPMGFAS